jgi:hypothetical protein
MNSPRVLRALSVGLLAALTGCAINLWGPEEIDYGVLAFEVPGGTSAGDVAQRIRDAGADVVLLSAAHDSAWLAGVAEATGRKLSGPGAAGRTAFAFLAGEAVGDTTLALPFGDADTLHVLDALYELDDERWLDLLLVGVDSTMPLREAIRTFLTYVATDVMQESAVMVAIDTGPGVSGAELAALLQPAFTSVAECSREGEADGGFASAGELPMHLFFGPEARVRCRSARVLPGAGEPVYARLIVRR